MELADVWKGIKNRLTNIKGKVEGISKLIGARILKVSWCNLNSWIKAYKKLGIYY